MADKIDLLDIEVWDGNMAASQAMRQAQIDVVAAYPITPSTPVVQNYSTFLANNQIDGEFVMVESEHAAMSGCVGASAAGGRVATATSSQGFALMCEVLYQASGMRLPIVMHVVNRALAAPLNVNGDHSDMYLGRDSGWIQADAFNAQEAYDLGLMAFKISEDHKVRLPMMIHQDGFMTSHTAQGVKTLSDDVAYNFIGEFKPMNAMLDLDRPATHGVQTEEDYHYEFKARQHHDLMTFAKAKTQEVFDEFETLTGRKYSMIQEYDMEGADIAIVCMGTSVETARLVATDMRTKGIKAGVIGIRIIRPWPFEEIKEALKDVKAVAALDRSSPNGALGMLYNELAGCLLQNAKPSILSNYVYGLGGRDLTKDNIKQVFTELKANADTGKLTTPTQQWISLNGEALNFF
ncbi:MAG: 2-oxoacid:ferredoxin oxidoreductase subunit alpha [Helicobacteraceae bacterium]|nr:2-oxoacid:ferredoxin oxidoreductase subunit alpha [Helicobacteraceae bacterium]